ncbi:MAG: M48 family metallopeptidase [Planctomycetota bacterium]
MHRTFMLALTIISASLLAGGCTVNPATGKRSFTLLTWEQEKQLGAESAFSMGEQFGGDVPSAELQAYTDRVGMDMVAHIEEGVPELEWEFSLLNSPVINAFALPGGKVFITRGLCEQMSNEAQFAAVIGHEIGHVTARHGNQRISQQSGVEVVLAALGFAIGAADEESTLKKYGSYGLPVLQIGGQYALLGYSRGQEIEADMLGVRYMSKAGYDPLGARQVQEILLGAAGSTRPSLIEGLQATHPYPQDRIDAIDRLLAGEYKQFRDSQATSLYADRWERSFMPRLRRLPAAPVPDPVSMREGRGMILAAQSWCAHCAAAATHKGQ